jgi:hypothetical protein
VRRAGGDAVNITDPTTAARLAEGTEFDPLTGCLVWKGGKDHGYGMIRIGPYAEARCHRVAWVLAHGAIPDGLHVLHRCDNPPCCNVDHLFLGDQCANMQDMAKKKRSRNGAYLLRTMKNCARGHEFSEENTSFYVDGFGKSHRRCLKCDALRTRLYRARLREGAGA